MYTPEFLRLGPAARLSGSARQPAPASLSQRERLEGQTADTLKAVGPKGRHPELSTDAEASAGGAGGSAS